MPRRFTLANAYKHWPGWRKKVYGNPAPIDPKHPLAPAHHPLPHPPKPVAASKPLEQRIVYYANRGLRFAGRMVYSETADRSELFSRKPGDFQGAHADCSQYVASILHWLGVKSVTSADYTGTLLQKGKLLPGPALGAVAIWGPGTGAHAAFVTARAGSDWYVVGFGHQGAPDRSTLSGMNAYFEGVGQPGVRYLDFAA